MDVGREGLQEGLEKGLREGYSKMNRLIERLFDDGRIDDLRRAAKDPDYQEQLMREYGILSGRGL